MTTEFCDGRWVFFEYFKAQFECTDVVLLAVVSFVDLQLNLAPRQAPVPVWLRNLEFLDLQLPFRTNVR